VDWAKNILRKKYLKKYSSDVPTGITQMSDIKTAVACINVEDPTFDDCKLAIQAFYREFNIKGEIFFLDLRKITKEERLITSITNTVLKKDLDWCGKPSDEKIKLLLDSNPDMFISMINSKDFTIEFMAKCSRAKFKIGRQQLPGGTFDLVIADSPEKTYSEVEAFEAIRKFIKNMIAE